MKLHSPEFEKRLKRTVRQTVRSSPELRKEARRTRTRKHYSLRTVGRICLAGVLAVGVSWVADRTENPAAALAMITLWMFVWACARIANLLGCIYSDPELAALSLLPLSAADVFRWQFQKFARASMMSLLDLFAGLAAFGWYFHVSSFGWVMLFFIALLSWVLFMAAVLFCAARRPGLPYVTIPAFGFIVAMACVVTRPWIANHFVAFLNRFGPEINLLPMGWPLSLSRMLIENDQWLKALLLLPIAGLIWTIKNSFVRLKADYEFNEVTEPEAPDMVPDELEAESNPTAEPERHPIRIGLTEIEEIILSRALFEPPKWWANGRLEKFLWNWFSPREQALADFVFPGGIQISKAWISIFRNLLVFVFAAILAGFLSPLAQVAIFGVGFFVTFCQVLAAILGTGQAFAPVPCSGVSIPMYAVYTVGFRELARMLFKCSFVQFPLVLLFGTVCGVMILYLMGFSVTQGMVAGLKVGALLLALRFLAVTFAFSAGTNDTSRFRVRTSILFISMAFLSLVFVGLAAASVFLPFDSTNHSTVNWPAWISLLLAVFDAYVLFRVYGWFYHANRFDLMKAAQ